MYEHYDLAATDYEIFFHLNSGGVYKVALDLSDSNNPTTLVTLRGNLDPKKYCRESSNCELSLF